MQQYTTYQQAENLKEVQNVTNNLDKSKLVPLQINDGGVIKNVTKFNGVYNISKGDFCTIVSPNYNLIQHKQYIDNFAQALDRLNIKYKMIIKQQGNKVFADIEFTEKKHKFKELNEEFMIGLRLVNSYNKTTGLGILARYKRLACMNGMIVTRDENVFTVKHNSKLLNELESFIEKRINLIISNSEELKNWVSNSMKDSIEWTTVCKILEKIILQRNHREEILKQLNISMIEVKEKNTKKVKIKYVLDNKEKKKLTRWDIYNAVTYYLSHGEQITPHIEECYQKHAEKILMNPLKVLAK